MAIKTFASIYIGSFEVSMKIFELSSKKSIRTIDNVDARLDLGKDSFVNRNLGYEIVDQLCDILSQFKEIMQGYKVDDYEIYTSSVLRDSSNALFVLDQIHLRTGFTVNVISNSEHRFLSYKSVAGQARFEGIVSHHAAVIDVGGVGIQITIFKDGHIVTTQHMDIGTIRLYELLHKPGLTEKAYRNQIEEYINKKLEVFRALYLDAELDYIIFMNDYGINFINGMELEVKGDNLIKTEKFVKYLVKLSKNAKEDIIDELNLTNDKSNLIIPSIILFKALATKLTAKEVWIPGVNVNDGIAFDYADRDKLLKGFHNFDEDVITAALAMSEHYNSYSTHIEALTKLTVQVFDAIKRTHGLGSRQRLLLQVATILHDCGKFVSLSNSAESAYNIIMSSEIIGLTHLERQIVALTVLFNSIPLCDYGELDVDITKEDYLTAVKLSAILRLSNALDQSHKQKFKNIKISLREKKMIISVESFEDISLEQTLFASKTSYFENVFSIKPVLREKKVMM